MMLDVTEGMAYLHATTHQDGTPKPKVYHQDLKSANVLLTRETSGSSKMRGKISDFGLSHLKKAQPTATASGSDTISHVALNGGTRCYQAPELFKKTARFSSRADVFAAGIVFLELIALQPPNHLHRALWPAILEVRMPLALCALLRGCLAAEPSERATFAQLGVVLQSAEGHEIAAQDVDVYHGSLSDFTDVTGLVMELMSDAFSLGI